MKIFHFSGHDVPRADIINANITFSYADLRLFVDVEIRGGSMISLNQDDSLMFLEDFMQQIRATNTTS